MEELTFRDWGVIDYAQALEQQQNLAEEVARTDSAGYLVFCTHPPIVTLGRGTQEGDVFAWPGATLEVSRGGRATYHGPNQLVVYPIVNLTKSRKQRKDREIVGYLRAFEKAIVDTLQEYDVPAEGRSQNKDETGVWVQNRKIASLGIAVRKWVTFHGAAINLSYDPQAFQGLNPCGFHKDIMISLEQILNREVETSLFKEQLKKHLLREL